MWHWLHSMTLFPYLRKKIPKTHFVHDKYLLEQLFPFLWFAVYASLVADLARDFKVFHYSLEISVRGQVSKENHFRLKSLAYEFCLESKLVTRSLINYGSKDALLRSFFFRKKWAVLGIPKTHNSQLVITVFLLIFFYL